jgi:hypothetical protein
LAHRYHKTAYQKYIQQTFKPFQVGGLSLHPEYKLSWNTRFIETNCNEVMQKQSLMLKYYFNSDSQLIKRLLRVAMWQDNDEVINR